MSLKPADLIILPVYNEEASVDRVLEAIAAAAPGIDLVAVDDGSTDGSRARLEAAARWWPARLELVTHPENQGYGAALQSGFRFAIENGYRRAVTMDCDEQHEPALIRPFLDALDETGADVVSGSRYLQVDVREAPPPADRWRINREITAEINRITGFGLTDAFCGFKAYRVASLRRLELTERGYGFPIQFWIRAWRQGLKVVERPVPLIYKRNFERRFGGGLDDPAQRRAYYLEVLQKEVTPCSTC